MSAKKTFRPKAKLWCLALFTLLALSASAVMAQTTTFTYQGRLTDAGNPANGNYDLQFKLFDTVTVGTGTQQGATVTVSSVAVAAGVFTVQLDFGVGAFPGAARFLEIAVKPISGGTFTVLGPRQPITSTPYAIKSANATAADSLSPVCVGCVTGAQIGSLPTNSGSYIQNTTTPQTSSNFNLSGNGTAGGTLSGNIVNAATQYNLGGSRLVSAPGANLFVGLNAAATGPTGVDNTYVGNFAGNASTTGDANSFFGVSAGFSNQASGNSFFGRSAGFQNRLGANNSFFGTQAGRDNCPNGCDGVSQGSNNSFFGRSAGQNNTVGFNNSFFGQEAGLSNTTGKENVFIGLQAGYSNQGGLQLCLDCGPSGGPVLQGAQNTFTGVRAGFGNVKGTLNAFYGAFAGFNNTSDANSFFGAGAGYRNVEGDGNAFVGWNAGRENSSGSLNTLFGSEAGRGNTIGWSNTFIGRSAAINNVSGSNNTVIGAFADVGSFDLTFATAIGAGTIVTASNRVQIGRPPSGSQSGDTVAIGAFASASSSIPVCINVSGVFTNCTASSQRYKENIQPLRKGLELIQRLRPVTFNWKEDHAPDLGLIAEEVNEVAPLLNTYDKKGVVEGVKYTQLTLVLINAVKEQQAQIETQQTLIKRQQQQLDALKKLVCQTNPQAAACQD